MERDRRYRSRMSAEHRIIDARMSRWAHWSRMGLEELGYPTESCLGRLIRCGFTGAAQPGPVPEMPPDVAEMERELLKLLRIEYRVLTRIYLVYQPPEAHARQMRMTLYRWRKLRERAMNKLARALLTSAINS